MADSHKNGKKGFGEPGKRTEFRDNLPETHLVELAN